MAAAGNMMSLRTGKAVGAEGGGAFDEGFIQDTYKDTAPVTTDTYGTEQSEQTKRGTGWSRVSRAPPGTLAALDSLMAQLQAGGSEEDKFISAARREEIGRARGFQGQFSPEAARTAGTSLISKSISDALAQLMPGITAYSEGAGTSKGSMRALLTQRAGEKGAIEGAALAANLSSAYGGLQANLEATLNELTKQDPHSPLSQLAQLIIGSKGIVENTDSFNTDTSRASGKKQGQSTIGRQQEATRTVKTPLEAQAVQQRAQGGYTAPYTGNASGYISRTGGGTSVYGEGGFGDFVDPAVYQDMASGEISEADALSTGGGDMETTYQGLTSGSESDVYEGGGSYYEEEY